ncbi:uncharacterized protein MEPE_06098 [Melanopsichium pennsylvanicum]|uniref:Uncharacterized protein n=1 Tax=Melanopsichium pennsylvanicum TaxID=63383 RepID=A0AAJ5C8A9_9BASI|nr:uncharacterized protein MEPE_06098 [Melanopsichium pennsylvanicum]
MIFHCRCTVCVQWTLFIFTGEIRRALSRKMAHESCGGESATSDTYEEVFLLDKWIKAVTYLSTLHLSFVHLLQFPKLSSLCHNLFVMRFITALLPSLALLSFSDIFSNVFAAQFEFFDSPVHNLPHLRNSLQNALRAPNTLQIQRFPEANIRNIATNSRPIRQHEFVQLFQATEDDSRTFIYLDPQVYYARSHIVVAYPPRHPHNIRDAADELTFAIISAPRGRTRNVPIHIHGYVKAKGVHGIQAGLPARNFRLDRDVFNVGDVISKNELVRLVNA